MHGGTPIDFIKKRCALGKRVKGVLICPGLFGLDELPWTKAPPDAAQAFQVRLRCLDGEVRDVSYDMWLKGGGRNLRT